MGLPVAAGVAVLFVLADRWRMERAQLAAWGVEEPDALDRLVAGTGASKRAAQVAAIAELGGEVVNA